MKIIFRDIMKKRYKNYIAVLCVSIAGVFIAPAVLAANLYFSPFEGSFKVGDTFAVGVFVSSVKEPMNAVSANISYPAEFLDVISLSKNNSVIDLWIQEPTFSNTKGNINFEGITLNPGFNGSSGRIITVNFKVKAAGDARMSFAAGNILANDGKGTSILTSMGSADFVFTKTGASSPSADQATGQPQAPNITSSTHPDSDKWYPEKIANFSWDISGDIITARLLIGKIPQASPTVTYTPAVESKEIKDLDDGIWYFHVSLANSAGWGPVSHFRLQIDTKKPDFFNISQTEREDLTDPRAEFLFDSKDSGSGIDYYEIQIDAMEPEIWRRVSDASYKTPALGPGSHKIVVKAFDMAGNFLEQPAEFTVLPIEPPQIMEYSTTLNADDSFYVKGITVPAYMVTIFYQKEGGLANSKKVVADSDGLFFFSSGGEYLPEGSYSLWAEATDPRGAKSGPSSYVIFDVLEKQNSSEENRYMLLFAIAGPLLIMLIVLIFLLQYSRKRFDEARKKTEKEIEDVEESAHKTFELLREDVMDQLKTLEKVKTKKDLIHGEEDVTHHLEDDLVDAEKFLEEKIEKIEEELK